jgi:hypothetical protein
MTLGDPLKFNPNEGSKDAYMTETPLGIRLGLYETFDILLPVKSTS